MKEKIMHLPLRQSKLSKLKMMVFLNSMKTLIQLLNMLKRVGVLILIRPHKKIYPTMVSFVVTNPP
jgi:hypothetical protein